MPKNLIYTFALISQQTGQEVYLALIILSILSTYKIVPNNTHNKPVPASTNKQINHNDYTYGGKSLQRGETILLRRGRLFEGLVLLDEGLHLVDGVAQLLRHEVRLLRDQPRLRHGRVARELVHLQDCGRGTTQVR